MLTRLIGRLVCHFRGHRRGKRVRAEENSTVKFFQCPRCGATWARKIRKASAA